MQNAICMATLEKLKISPSLPITVLRKVVGWDFGHRKVGFWQNQVMGLWKGGILTCGCIMHPHNKIIKMA